MQHSIQCSKSQLLEEPTILSGLVPVTTRLHTDSDKYKLAQSKRLIIWGIFEV